MYRIKETTLNGLLAVLVILSIALSYRVWFPSDRGGLWLRGEAQVQSSPPSQAGQDPPDVHRPERIYVTNKDGKIALLPAGSAPYTRVWSGVKNVPGMKDQPGLRDVLTGLQPLTGQLPPEDEVDRTGDSITLVLPIPLMLDQWAQIWKWGAAGLPNFSLKVDRVTVYLGKTPVIYFSGATGGVYRVGPLSQADQQLLKARVAEIDPASYRTYRPLTFKDSTVKLSSGLVVPTVTEIPLGTVAVKTPDAAVAQARYFPDLSVVRHIEERDANSFTDGQRWLRLTLSGQTEYVTAPPAGAPPDLNKSRDAAKTWVQAHDGWSPDLVLNEYIQQPGRSMLVYNLRLDGGSFPVETAGGTTEKANGAMMLEFTTRDQVPTVLQYRRYPDFVPQFTRGRAQVKAPEVVLQETTAQFPSLFLFEGEVREMHLAYLVWLPDKLSAWRLEPVWVISVGEKRVYTPATSTSDMKPFTSGA